LNRVAAFAANAPLMSVPGASSPPGGVGEWYRGAGGLRLRAALWRPEGRARGTVVLSTGRTEPIEKYYETIADFLARDFCVLAHDWRGQGLSARLLPERLKGHARAVEEFLDDYSRLLDTYEAAAPKPWIMVGHSMGGVLNLLSLEAGELRFAGAVLSSPMLRIRTGKRSLWSVRFAARWNVRHGKAGDYVLDDHDDPFEHSFGKDALTHDQNRYERWREQLYACPHLAVGGITWGWLHFAVDAGERALRPKALRKVRTPLTIVQAADDTRVWKASAKWAAKRIPKARYVEVPVARHEILMEIDDLRGSFLREFDAMADQVAPRLASADSTPSMSPTLGEELRASSGYSEPGPSYETPSYGGPESSPEAHPAPEPYSPPEREPEPSLASVHDADAAPAHIVVPNMAPSAAPNVAPDDDERPISLDR
jgi:lysophospholipase